MWGGARNSASRTSDCLSRHQVESLKAAAFRSISIGLPLNRFITIHWEQAAIPDDRAAWATGRYVKLVGDWVRRRGGTIAWIRVRENGDRKGSHVHILMHVPAGLSLGPMQRRWLRLITGKAYQPRTVLTERIGGAANAASRMPDVYTTNLRDTVGYLLKGAPSSLALDRQEDGGTIIGKRAARSLNLGQSRSRDRL